MINLCIPDAVIENVDNTFTKCFIYRLFEWIDIVINHSSKFSSKNRNETIYFPK